jgi:poly-gamma-glutamate synthesis protein (capsule biosynthesis protein)
MMDFGEQGMTGTSNSLNQMGIKTIGVGMNTLEAQRPLMREIHGIKIAILNIAEGEEAKASTSRAGVAPLDVALVRRQISDLVNDTDVIFVVIHAGREFLPVPPPYIQSAYRAIADAGASLIVAHHPHVPQGVEIWNGVPIFYSQGNFVLMDEKGGYRNLGYLVQAAINKTGIDFIKIIPYRINRTGLGRLTGEDRRIFLQDLSNVSSFLDPNNLTSIWNAYADLWIDTRFSVELRQFLQLMSWKELSGGYSDRLRYQAQQKDGIVKLTFKLLGFVFSRLSNRLTSDTNLNDKAAAVLRNRFDTLAHRELYKTVLQRIMEGRVGDSDEWAQELLIAWRALD